MFPAGHGDEPVTGSKRKFQMKCYAGPTLVAERPGLGYALIGSIMLEEARRLRAVSVLLYELRLQRAGARSEKTGRASSGWSRLDLSEVTASALGS